MAKNKIPIWENLKNYRSDVYVIGDLLALSDKDFQIRVWVYATLPEMDWYDECLLKFDDGIEFMKKDLRKGRLQLTPKEIKAVLRVHAMCDRFVRLVDWKSVPEGWVEEQSYIINHPYFEKIRQKAAEALELFRLPAPPRD